MIKKILLSIIKLYQKTISPDHSKLNKYYAHSYCKYQPTCSDYTYQAIEKYGVSKGILKGFWRICRCNPWSRGGWDPIK